ncbi:MAG: hypothetical protein ACLT3H_00945 [Roseburia sp.]
MMHPSEFDMKEYIRKRMLEITQLEDRAAYKEIVGNLLLELYEYNKNAYQKLEERILNEYSPEQKEFAIHISLTDRTHYDATDTFLYPMAACDTDKTEISFAEVKTALKEKRELKLYTVYLEKQASVIYQLLHSDRTFGGVIKTRNRECAAKFRVEQNTEYMGLIKELYDIFGLNYQPWSTVCTAYLAKMLDVYLCLAEPLQEEEIMEIRIDFEEYEAHIRYDMVPLWNLSPMAEKTSTYPNPSTDKINFEHQIFSHRLKQGCEYLIRNTEAEITNIRRQNGDIFITCPVDIPYEWILYQVNRQRGTENYPYPVLSNQHKDSFAGSITEMFKRSIKTKGELARLLESFAYQDYVVFQDACVQSDVPSDCAMCSYNMDGFMQDELRVGNARQALVIDFAPVDPENYLNEDIMSFLVTQAQKLFPEYYCVGQLVESGGGVR